MYLWQPEEKYAQTTLFVIDQDYENAADEMMQFIKTEVVGCILNVGVPLKMSKQGTI